MKRPEETEVYAVFVLQPGLKYFKGIQVLLALFSKEEDAIRYEQLRHEEFPDQELTIDRWIVDDPCLFPPNL